MYLITIVIVVVKGSAGPQAPQTCSTTRSTTPRASGRMRRRAPVRFFSPPVTQRRPYSRWNKAVALPAQPPCNSRSPGVLRLRLGPCSRPHRRDTHAARLLAASGRAGAGRETRVAPPLCTGMSVAIWISHISDNAVRKNDCPALVQGPWEKEDPPVPTDMYGSPLQLRGSLGKHETGAPRVIVSALPFHHTIPYATAPHAMRFEIPAPIFGSFDGNANLFRARGPKTPTAS